MPAVSRTCLVLFCWIHSVRQSSANPGQLVEPRKLAVLADGEGGDWNSGRRLCRSVNMTLATVDRHVVSFLLQQTQHAKFQRYPHQQFWIGMYHEEGSPGSRGKYRWEADCAEVLSGSLWASGQPVDSDDLLCVLADHLTLRWKTADCRVRQNFLCQRKEDACSYQRTLPTCTLYITASFRFTLPGGTPRECQELCDTSLKGSLPCWGFTLTGEGCVLHYQAAQPPCDIHHLQSSAYFRTCFNIFYVDGPFNRNPSNSSLPQVPHCSTSTQLASARNLSDPRLYTTELPSEANLSTTTSEPRYTTPDTSSLLPSATPQPNTTTATTSASSPTAMTSSIMTSATTAQTTLSPSVSAVFPPVVPTVSPKSSIAHLCWCKCDMSRRNKTVVLEEAEVTKRKLKIDVTTLSSTRRKKCSAEDNRVSSKGIAYIGISFVAVIAAWIVLPDIVSVTYHVWYGVPRNWTKLSKPASVRVH